MARALGGWLIVLGSDGPDNVVRVGDQKMESVRVTIGVGEFRVNRVDCSGAGQMSGQASPTATASTVIGEDDAPVGGLAPGERVDRYLVTAEIGRGGMGVVYRADDPELNRAVALKLLPVDIGESIARDRLRREAQGLAQLSHPNVVTVHDVGICSAGVYLAMEFVDGQTLSEWAKTADRSWREVVEVFAAAGRGLAAAHHAGLVHRDVKPSNIVITEDGRVKVIDFGLVRAAETEPLDAPGLAALEDDSLVATGQSDDSSSSPSGLTSSTDTPLSTPLTLAGTIMGSPRYMSPEQHLGGKTGPASDQFSFCVALYELLYGELPFPGKTRHELRAAVFQGQMRSPPARARVPARLRRLLVRGLSVAPEDRFPNMEALLAELEPRSRTRYWIAAASAIALASGMAAASLLASNPTSCRDDSDYLRGVWDGDRRAALRAGFERGLGARGADAYTRIEREIDRYATAVHAMRVDSCEATRVRGEQSAELMDLRTACLRDCVAELGIAVTVLSQSDKAELDRAHEVIGALPAVEACADARALRRGDALPEDPVRQETARRLGDELAEARILHRIGRLERATEMAKRLVAETRGLGYRPLEAEAQLLSGRLAESNGDYEGARWTLRGALRLALASGRVEVAISAQIALASIEGVQLEKHREGRAWLEDAEFALQGLGDRPDLRRELLSTTGMVAMSEGEYAAAEKALLSALELVGSDLASPEAARLHTSLGTTMELQGRFDEALAQQRQAMEIWTRAVGADHPEVGATYNNMAITYAQKGASAEALEYFRRAQVVWEGAHGRNHPDVARVLNNIGLMMLRSGDMEGGRAELQQAMEVWNQVLGPDNYRLASALINIGASYRIEKRWDDALAAFERARELTLRHVGPDHVDLADVLLELGRTYTEAGRSAQAIAPLERAMALHVAHPGSPIALAEVRAALAAALETSDRRRARRLAKAALEGFENASSEYDQERAKMKALLE